MRQRIHSPAITINRYGVIFFNRYLVAEMKLHEGQKLKILQDGYYSIEILEKHDKLNTIYRRGRGLYMQGSINLRPGTYLIEGYEGRNNTYKEPKR